MLCQLLLAIAPAMGPAPVLLQAPSGDEVPRMPTAAAQLAHAGRIRAKVRGTRGAARVEALEAALAAYRAVTEFWPDGGSVLAEAAFRRGEIQRTLGRPGEAIAAFQEAFDAGKGTGFRPRALLEIGHVHRRAARFEQALESYGRVLALEGVALRQRNDAREWTGKVHLQLGDWTEAAAAFAAWAANAESGPEIVRAADLEARAWIQAGELERAEEVLQRTRSSLESLAQEPGKEAEALRRALERMKAPDLLRETRERAAAEAAGEGA